MNKVNLKDKKHLCGCCYWNIDLKITNKDDKGNCMLVVFYCDFILFTNMNKAADNNFNFIKGYS